jgi:hypothetical protein
MFVAIHIIIIINIFINIMSFLSFSTPVITCLLTLLTNIYHRLSARALAQTVSSQSVTSEARVRNNKNSIS